MQWTLEHRCLIRWSVLHLQRPSIEKAKDCGSSCLVFGGSSLLFCVLAVPSCCYPKKMWEGSHFSRPSAAFIVGGVFVNDCCEWWEVVPYCGFDVQFCINERSGACFLCFNATSWDCLLEGSLCFDMLSNYPPQHFTWGEGSLQPHKLCEFEVLQNTDF